ncbi:MAG: NAD-binding protein, partial [Dehalococcoidia bacterium]|nr:NAD-binding protein [Dehalococcoidia bacterium]
MSQDWPHEEVQAVNVVIMGCGRVGAKLASMLDTEGHRVTIMDTDSDSFRRLTPE